MTNNESRLDIHSVNKFADKLFNILDNGGTIDHETLMNVFKKAVKKSKYKKNFGNKMAGMTKKELHKEFSDGISKAQAEAKLFENLTGVDFTINNARECLFSAADSAMVYLYDDDTNVEKFETASKYFNDVLRSLPRRSLSDISALIKVEVLAHLRLKYGDTVISCLTPAFIRDTFWRCNNDGIRRS